MGTSVGTSAGTSVGTSVGTSADASPGRFSGRFGGRFGGRVGGHRFWAQGGTTQRRLPVEAEWVSPPCVGGLMWQGWREA